MVESSRLGPRGGSASAPEIRLARVVRRAAPVTRTASPTESPIVVEIGSARVSVTAGFDQATLAAVLDALAARRGAR